MNTKYGICKGGCSEEKAIYCSGMCEYCYWKGYAKKNRKKREQGNKVYGKPRQKIKNRSEKGQKISNKDAAFFRDIWRQRSHVSEISGIHLGDEFNVCYFSHVLAKGTYPRARHWKENIMLKTFEEHQEWEFSDRSKPEFKKKFAKVMKRYNELIIRYYQ